ncbi:restriction endonuclease [Mycolicibacterium fortuitum]|nr:restriction endonuclease [Mycolicibacterium fortuitum]
MVGPSTDDAAGPLEMIENGVAAVHAQVAAELLNLSANKPRASSISQSSTCLSPWGTEARTKTRWGWNAYTFRPNGIEENSVQRPDIQGFVGALHGMGANRGIFITTSRFSSGAREYATGIGTRVVLIDGQRLSELMIKYGVGVQKRQVFTVVEVDEDYFE